MFPRAKIVRFFSGFTGKKLFENENFINVDNVKLHYVKAGYGPKIVVMLPGGLGTGISHFKKQLENFDHETFTMVAWDPPGFGQSRPHKRVWKDFFWIEADLIAKMMQQLKYPKYSVMGWSAGATTAMILASNYGKKHVEKLVFWGGMAKVWPYEREQATRYRNVDIWNEKIVEEMTKMYGEKEFREHAYQVFNMAAEGDDFCSRDLDKIICPTLILHGDKDEFISDTQIKYIEKNIKNSMVYRFPEGRHTIHRQYPEEFNSVVEKFLKSK